MKRAWNSGSATIKKSKIFHEVDNFSLRGFLFLFKKQVTKMETKSFFGEQGLSSTRANQIAELADRYADRAKSVVSSVQFYSEQMRIPGEEPILVENGTTKENFNHALECLNDIVECNSLIAFFREAIKEKEALSKEAKAWTDVEHRNELAAKRAALTKPVRQNPITEDDVKRSWSVGEQEKFLSLQAECSVYGKFIHKDGALDIARKDLLEKMKHPRIVKGEGRDITVTEFVPSMEFEHVDASFQKLQATWRDLQGQLNGMKKKIEDTIAEDTQEKTSAFGMALRQYNSQIQALDREEEEIMCEEMKVRAEMLENIQSLKIVVPKRLQGIFDKLTK